MGLLLDLLEETDDEDPDEPVLMALT